MKYLSGNVFRILITLAFAFPVAHLISQSKQTPRDSQPGYGTRVFGAGLDYAAMLRRLDADQDGFITRSEWDGFFDKSDSNADKRISSEELQPSLHTDGAEEELDPDRGRLAAFERLDANKNDAIESQEWPGKVRDFRYLDANHNGSLSREEFLSRNGRWWNEPFDNLDFSGDGIIVRTEWLDSNSSFDRLDRDHNGVIERHEFYNPQ
jgi:Ca2+-binding EF-hand superfamily protein